jgi:hypothetical protein
LGLASGPEAELAELELAELEPKQHLVKADLTGPLEAVALVKGDRAAVALTSARVQHPDSGSATEVLDDQVQRCSAEALSLVTLVNEELPQYCGMYSGLPTSSAVITNPTGVSSAYTAQYNA